MLRKNIIPLKTIPVYEPFIDGADVDSVMFAMRSGWISSLGPFLDKFEKGFAEFCGTVYALTTSNGTASLHLALAALGIGRGDEVIIPDLTFVATANAVSYTGAKVVPVDIDDKTRCIDPDKIKDAITKRTKAIIPVHLYGHPANMIEILKIADQYGLHVIEDAAEAHGAEVQGKKVGSFGEFGAFSFYANKIITTGEGGMLTTGNPDLYEKARYLRDHAMSHEKRYWHEDVGFNYRMTNIQAALGLSQLSKISDIIEKKRRIFGLYKKYLGKIPGVRLNETEPWAGNVYWMVCMENQAWDEGRRNRFMGLLKDRGIDTRPYFYPISLLPRYKDPSRKRHLSRRIFSRGINLPSSPRLTKVEIEFICNTVVELLEVPSCE